MKNIMTAIDNSKINELLKKEEKIKIIGKDILYKEGVIEQLEKNKKINTIIINEKIDGEIPINKLIKKIKEKNKNIEIIIITESKNIEIKESKKVKIYETNKIKIKELIKIINSYEDKNIENKRNMVTITNSECVSKTLIINLENRVEKVQKENIIKTSKKNIILVEPNLIGIKKGKKIINNYLNNFKINKNNIFILINKKNKICIDSKIIKQIFNGIKIIGEINN